MWRERSNEGLLQEVLEGYSRSPGLRFHDLPSSRKIHPSCCIIAAGTRFCIPIQTPDAILRYELRRSGKVRALGWGRGSSVSRVRVLPGPRVATAPTLRPSRASVSGCARKDEDGPLHDDFDAGPEAGRLPSTWRGR